MNSWLLVSVAGTLSKMRHLLQEESGSTRASTRVYLTTFCGRQHDTSFAHVGVSVCSSCRFKLAGFLRHMPYYAEAYAEKRLKDRYVDNQPDTLRVSVL